MDKRITQMFLSQQGSKIYDSAYQMLARYGMIEELRNGVLVGLSGGADSIMLLSFLCEFRSRNFDFPIVASHVNHLIRGDEAYRDETFCREMCEKLNVPIYISRINIPELASKSGESIEECARSVRYSEFQKIISSREDITWIFTAHNMGDNAETVLLNILRGSGTRGGAGIPCLRDNVFRPLIQCLKSDIVSALDGSGIPYVTDNTNSSIDYSRNYLRLQIIPSLKRLTPSPEEMISRFSSNLRSDDDYISSVASEFLLNHKELLNVDLRALHDAVFARVIKIMAGASGVHVIQKHLESIKENLNKDNFKISLTGGTFICEYSKCSIEKKHHSTYDYCLKLKFGLNILDGFDADFLLAKDEAYKSSLNVYKISIQQKLSSAIIDGELYLRPKMDGDSVFYGGINHKLKKLFNDRKIPPSYRSSIPVLCDARGVVWVPGFGVRDDGVRDGGNNITACLLIGKSDALCDFRFRSGSEFKL